jgi:hypothetical protein
MISTSKNNNDMKPYYKMLYKIMCDSLLPKVGSTDQVSNQYKTILYYLGTKAEVNFAKVIFEHLCKAISDSQTKGTKNAHYCRFLSFMFHRSYLIQSLKPVFPRYGSFIDAYPSLISGFTVKKVLKNQGPLITPQVQYKPTKEESDKHFYLTYVSREEVTLIAGMHKKLLEGGDNQRLEDRLATRYMLPAQQKKRKAGKKPEATESKPKRARSSTPQKKSGNTSGVKNTSEVAEKKIVEKENPVNPEPAVQVEAELETNKEASASGSAAVAAPEVTKKARTNTKRKRKPRLILENEEHEEAQETIRQVELYNAWEETSWESGVDAEPNAFLDTHIPKAELVQRLANQGIYKKILDIPDYVINGPKHAKNIPYTVPIQNSFSKILSDLAPKSNCIEEVSASASLETPVVSFVPSPESMKQFSKHVLSLITEADVSTPTSVENVEKVAT